MIQSGEIAIPKYSALLCGCAKVRDFVDSLYNGYPWDTSLHGAMCALDGTKATGKRILIDGQQRVTALMASILGKEIIDKSTEKENSHFHPVEMRFEDRTLLYKG